MSRVAKSPVAIPAGVEIKQSGQNLIVKGAKGQLEIDVHANVVVAQEENVPDLRST